MDLRRLREETRLEHETTEAAMPLMAPGLTLDTYKGVLRTLLPIVCGWEQWADRNAPTSLRLLLIARRRSYLLEADLRSLGEPNEAASSAGGIDWDVVVRGGKALATEPASPEFTAAFLGAMYVLEGSTLGGRMIARHLEPVFSFEESRGDAYFRGHGEATGTLWRETTAAIIAIPEPYTAVVIEAARRTFDAFRTALEQLGCAESCGLAQG